MNTCNQLISPNPRDSTVVQPIQPTSNTMNKPANPMNAEGTFSAAFTTHEKTNPISISTAK